MKKLVLFALSIAFLAPVNAMAKSHRNTDKSNTYKQETTKKKKNRTVLGSTLGFGSVGALAAGVAGSGKWVPLGLAGGLLAGWAIGKAIEHSRKDKPFESSLVNNGSRNKNQKTKQKKRGK